MFTAAFALLSPVPSASSIRICERQQPWGRVTAAPLQALQTCVACGDPVERVTVSLRESVLCRFSDDPHCVLASVPPLALVCIELLLDGGLTFDRSACRVCGEMCIAVFADSHHWYIGPSPHDPRQINIGPNFSRWSLLVCCASVVFPQGYSSDTPCGFQPASLPEFCAPGPWVIGANMQCKSFVALQLEVALHFIERCAGEPTGGFEPPATFRTTKTPKTLLVNPYQLPAHGRLGRCAQTLSDRSLGVAENA